MKKRILMLGAGFMQGVAIRCAHERGWEVIAVDGNPNAPCSRLADRFEPIDLKDIHALASFARNLQKEGGLDGVFTAATDFSASVAYVARECGLNGHTYDAALNASDKIRMRRCFDASEVPSPAFVGIDTNTRADIFRLLKEKNISFPVVVKPVDNMGARGCRKVELHEEIDEAIDDAIHYSRNGSVIVEEYMDGPEFSLEALVYDGEIYMTGIADRHIFFPPYFIEMGHTIPSSFPEQDVTSLVMIFKKGVKALGLTHGAAKGDLKLTKKGPMVGEIAGRLSGGYMSGWTFPYSSGIDLTSAALDLAVGIRPESLVPIRKWTSAERAWISMPGKIKSVSGYEKARSLPFVQDVFPRSNPGDTVNFPVNNVEKCGNCLASAPERAQAVMAAEEACRSIILRLEARNPDSDRFLSERKGASSFPPDSFILPDELSPDVFDSFSSFSQTDVSFSGTTDLPVPDVLLPYLDSVFDWQGRSLRQACIQACEIEPDLSVCLRKKNQKEVLSYWKALLRGGIQGIVYVYDSQIS